MVPFPLITTEPLEGCTVIELTVKASPSTSVSLGNTDISTGTSGSVDAVSLSATGASFIGLTVIVKVLLDTFALSVAVYTVGNVPLKFADGVNE